ncbi:MAG: CCA tRNA nucleotidyltransferase [Candidatus Micrarchaeales archaeon]
MDSKVVATRKIYELVLKGIKPSKLEIDTTIANANKTMSRLKKIIPKDVTLVVAGSIARSTNLKGDHDIDIFMLFPKKVAEKKMEKMGLEYAKRIIDKKKGERFEIKYAQHPYARLHLDDINMKIDVVPAYKIDNIEELATAVDRTPLHTKFINKHFGDKQRDDVRLLKYLLKAHNIYGAEVKTQGFSGYLCELLVYSYGSLDNLLQNVVKFRLPLYINPKDMNAKPEKETFKIFNSEFVVIDPVDKDRNVAAGVSKESLARFVLVAQKFLEKPDVKLFYGTGFSHAQAKKNVEKLLKDSSLDLHLLVTKVPDKSEDIIWPQLRKTSEIIAAHAKKFGFGIYLSHVWVDKSRGFIAYLAPREVRLTRAFPGPSAFYGSKSVNAFMKSHKNAFAIMLDEDKLIALDSNKYSTLEHLMLDVAKGKLVGDRKDISLKAAKLFKNKVPAEYAETLYAELHSKISI